MSKIKAKYIDFNPDTMEAIAGQLSAKATSADGKDVKVSAGDTTPAFLSAKILGTTNRVTVTKTDAGANETLVIDVVGLGGTAEMQVSGGYIQYRPDSGASWSNLILVSSLVGATGSAGADGQAGTAGTAGAKGDKGDTGVTGATIELQVSGGYIQWRTVGGVSWTNLILVSSLVGATGTTGAGGATGATGKGISSTSYNAGTGVLTITYTDATTYSTADLRDTAVEININFLDLTPFVYNVPKAMVLTAQAHESTIATLSIALNTNMARYDKLTITPAVIGLITLTGTLL